MELDNEVTQRLPVRPQLVGEPAGGAVAGEPEVLPDQVLVTGPESLIAKYDGIKTWPLNLDGHSETFEQTIGVTSPDPLIQVVQPSKVNVKVPMEPAAEANPGSDGGTPVPPTKPTKRKPPKGR